QWSECRDDFSMPAPHPLPCHADTLIVPHAGLCSSGIIATAGLACPPPERSRAVRHTILLATGHGRVTMCPARSLGGFRNRRSAPSSPRLLEPQSSRAVGWHVRR